MPQRKSYGANNEVGESTPFQESSQRDTHRGDLLHFEAVSSFGNQLEANLDVETRRDVALLVMYAKEGPVTLPWKGLMAPGCALHPIFDMYDSSRVLYEGGIICKHQSARIIGYHLALNLTYYPLTKIKYRVEFVFFSVGKCQNQVLFLIRLCQNQLHTKTKYKRPPRAVFCP